MNTMHSTLLIGHYDWEPEHLPKEEFAERLEALWKKVPADTAAIAVYGDRRANAELVYFTNFVPKLRDALAIFPRNGEPKLFVMGAPKMMDVAARQSWIKGPTPLGDIGKVLTQMKDQVKGPMVLVGGENLRLAQMKAVSETTSADASRAANAAVGAALRAKRAKELAEIRKGCAMLKAVARTFEEAHRAGKGATDALMEAEHAGHRMGAMEVRSLLSLDGGRTLRPFMTPVEKAVDPLVGYFAVRSNGYWSEGYVCLSKAPNAVAAKASEALKALIAAARPGAKAADLAQKVKESLKPFGEHPVTAGSAGNGIGLSLEEVPVLSASSSDRLAPWDIVSLRVGASGEGGHAIASAMVLVHDSGNEVLWSAG